MTKIFALGDFHGKISDSIINKIKKEKPDFILSPGDFCGNKELGKLFFKYLYGKDEESISNKIKKKSEQLEKIAYKDGVKVIIKIKSLGTQTFAVHGNWDPVPYPYDLGGEIKETKKESLKKLQNNLFKFVDFSFYENNNFILIGGGSSTSPGIPSFNLFKKELSDADNYHEKKELLIHFLKARREYTRRKILYKRLFSKAKRISNGRKIVFLTHNCPYKTKLDIIKSKHSHKKVRGKHYGSFLERKIIEKFQPDIVICGHMHENFGQDKIGKSIIFNVGSVANGKYKILNV